MHCRMSSSRGSIETQPPGESPIYRDLMRFKPEGLSPNAWAVKAGVSRTVWGDMRRHGNPSRRTLERLLAVAGSSLAEFEALRLGPEPQRSGGSGSAGLFEESRWSWGSAPLPPLPLVVSKLAGEWGGAGSGIEVTEIRPNELVERVARPLSLASDPEAFALAIVGDSMWPRFRLGRKVAVSPRAPVSIGDDVLVYVRDREGSAGRALLKQLADRTSGHIELRQFNPDVTFGIDVAEVEAVARVVGELI